MVTSSGPPPRWQKPNSPFSTFPSCLTVLAVSPSGPRLHGNRLVVIANLSTVTVCARQGGGSRERLLVSACLLELEHVISDVPKPLAPLLELFLFFGRSQTSDSSPRALPVPPMIPNLWLVSRTGPEPPQEGPGHVTAAAELTEERLHQMLLRLLCRTRLADDWLDAAGQLEADDSLVSCPVTTNCCSLSEILISPQRSNLLLLFFLQIAMETGRTSPSICLLYPDTRNVPRVQRN